MGGMYPRLEERERKRRSLQFLKMVENFRDYDIFLVMYLYNFFFNISYAST